jgi:hypothetical protein
MREYANKGGRGVGVRERLIRTNRSHHKVTNPTTTTNEQRTSELRTRKNQVGREPSKEKPMKHTKRTRNEENIKTKAKERT